MPRNFDQSVVRRPAKRRLLERSKPRPDRSPMVSTLLRHTLMLSSRATVLQRSHGPCTKPSSAYQHHERSLPAPFALPT